jgi:hypothetical protein
MRYVSEGRVKDILGLSTEDKPHLTGTGHTFLEVDTGLKAVWDGERWVEDVSAIYAQSKGLENYFESLRGIGLLDEKGNPYGVKQINGKPRVSTIPYLHDISSLHISGKSIWSKVGYNGDVDGGTEDIWAVGGLYVWPTAEMQMEVYSDSERDQQQAITAFATSDGGTKTKVTVTANHGLTNGDKVTISGCATAAYNTVHIIEQVNTNFFVIPVAYVVTAAAGIARGPGVNVVTIFYLNAAGVEKTEDVTIGPKVAVATVATDIYRINAFRSKTVGNTGKAVGNIDLRNLADTPIYARIAPGYTRSRNSAYTVPFGKTLFITGATFSSVGIATGKDVIFTLRTTYDDINNSMRTFFVPLIEIGLMDGAVHIPFDIPLRLPAGVDMIVTGLAGSDNAKCSSILRGWLE